MDNSSLYILIKGCKLALSFSSINNQKSKTERKMAKRLFMALVVCMLTCMGALAQSEGDKIIGVYKVERNGAVSKVKITKVGDGYRAQVCWLKEPNNPDGTPKRDVKNKDKSKRNTLASEIVLIEKVTYENGVWKNGRIYDPTKGSTFNVELKFADAKTLKVKGNWGPISSTSTWIKE